MNILKSLFKYKLFLLIQFNFLLALPIKLYGNTSGEKKLSINQFENFSNHDLQKLAMSYVSTVIDGIKTTDYNKSIWGLSQINNLPFERISSPLSLLYDLVNGIGEGREDFMILSFKNLFFLNLRKISQGVFRSVVKNKKYVSPETRDSTMKKLKSLRNNLDPKKEACSSILNNIDYVINVVEILPQNGSIVWESFKFLYCAIMVVAKKDVESLKYILKTIYNKSKALYSSSLLNQITVVEALSNAILSQNRTELFKKIIEIYKNTKLPGVKYNILKLCGKITREYYSGNIKNEEFSDIAYKSFELLLNAASTNKNFPLPAFWQIRCGAAEELILLENRLKDVNAKKTVNRYLKNLEKKESYHANKFLNKLGRKIGTGSAHAYVLNVLRNREQIYTMNIVREQAESIEIEAVDNSYSGILERLLKNQNKILELLKPKN